MYKTVILAVMLFPNIQVIHAAELTESECEEKVTAFIKSMESATSKDDEKTTLAGLTKKDIKEMQNEKGNCATFHYLHKRVGKPNYE